MLDENAARLGITFDEVAETSPDTKLEALIREAARLSPSRGAVLLIDEYDKPIVKYLGNGRDERLPQARAHHDALKQFYSALKDANENLDLVFITGVSALAKVSMFSDLNNLTNLTLEEPAADLVGPVEAKSVTAYDVRLHAGGVDVTDLCRWHHDYRSSSPLLKVCNQSSVLSYLL